ncbi:MAG: AAA family ATPase [Sulfurimonas sp.]|uniref:AAA family ATPase n=1 Tax=Sulfurimonas sp. TaxID=2022749 RepID=UPI0026243DF2|nr:AAA family ATPase [Sulfurimonas sp.]MDD5400953.1 AAA family ATPase [Sulfurimonas sp.]
MPEIIIKNCNSIDEANISIEIGKLNIKYGINGTGKSTIAKAIESNNNPDNLIGLLPFKYREENLDEIISTVEGAEDFTNIVIFNEEYINQFVFKQEELVENSFEIFIKDANYINNLHAVETLFSDIKTTFQEKDLSKIIEDLIALSGTFSTTKDGMGKNSKMVQALGNGNKIENIPVGLEDYTEYLQSNQNTVWIKWQTAGSGFLELSDKCPYCTSSTNGKIATIKKVSEEFNDKSISYLLNIITVMESLKIYFTDTAQETIEKITKNKIAINEAEESFLKIVKQRIDLLKKQLEKLQKLAYFTFDNVTNMKEEIESLKIDLSLMPELNSTNTQEIINPLNESLDRLIQKASELQGKIKHQKKQIGKKIDNYKIEINDFLHFAGYKYTIEIEEVRQEYKMKLRHCDLSISVEKGNQHLSYGEKNAFALMLFMYDCLSKNPDLIILDDPISSFDKNKKFAIIERLFRGEKSLRGKTVLMLTHDIDPIIDILKILPGNFEPLPVASFLKSRNGIIQEIPIVRDDLMTFAQVCNENITHNPENIIKLIYLRRYYEVLDNKGLEYQLLANLFHKREIPMKFISTGEVEMNEDEISEASASINNKITYANFDYTQQLKIMKNEATLKSIYTTSQSNYEKLQLFRIINIGRHPSDVIQKYINETYHIENEYVSQLNPTKYEMIPEFIIEECTIAINAL